MQRYIESHEQSKNAYLPPKNGFIKPISRKRKLSEDVPLSRDALSRTGILTPEPSSDFSRASSTLSGNSSTPEKAEKAEIYVYNGVLERKEGWILAKTSKHVKVPKINATTLPTLEMRQEAASTPIVEAEKAIRQAFYRKVKRIPNLNLENKIDASTPSLDFTFIKEYKLQDHPDVYRADPQDWEGCGKPCKPNMGGHCGCEWPKDCDCLEYAAVNEPTLLKDNPKAYEEYMRLKVSSRECSICTMNANV